MSAAQKLQAKKTKNPTRQEYVINIQNTHATLSLFLEFGADATSTDSLEIPPSGSFEYRDIKFSTANMISTWSNNGVKVSIQ